MHEYTGNVHIHSKYSDGRLSIKEIAFLAKDAGLDFIIITDHQTLEGFLNHEEGYTNDVLVMVGMEVNEACNHYLALDVEKTIENNENDPQKVVDEVNRQNGIGVIAHPVEKGSPFINKGRTYEWNDWSVRGFQGIEIWNYFSQYRDGFASILKGLYLLHNPHAALKGPYKKTMKILDRYQNDGHMVVAFGSSDAHGTQLKLGPLIINIASYALCFRCINMHILSEKKLSGKAAVDKEIIYNALRRGNSWISYDYFQNSKGFRFYLQCGGSLWSIGSKVRYQENMRFQVKTPAVARVKLIRNGSVWQYSDGQLHIFSGISKGVYRVEAYHRHMLGYRPWIFTNSIYIV